jgi:hypothetical protein
MVFHGTYSPWKERERERERSYIKDLKKGNLKKKIIIRSWQRSTFNSLFLRSWFRFGTLLFRLYPAMEVNYVLMTAVTSISKWVGVASG